MRCTIAVIRCPQQDSSRFAQNANTFTSSGQPELGGGLRPCLVLQDQADQRMALGLRQQSFAVCRTEALQNELVQWWQRCLEASGCMGEGGDLMPLVKPECGFGRCLLSQQLEHDLRLQPPEGTGDQDRQTLGKHPPRPFAQPGARIAQWTEHDDGVGAARRIATGTEMHGGKPLRCQNCNRSAVAPKLAPRQSIPAERAYRSMPASK